jgi:hypothetical protein
MFIYQNDIFLLTVFISFRYHPSQLEIYGVTFTHANLIF